MDSRHMLDVTNEGSAPEAMGICVTLCWCGRADMLEGIVLDGIL